MSATGQIKTNEIPVTLGKRKGLEEKEEPNAKKFKLDAAQELVEKEGMKEDVKEPKEINEVKNDEVEEQIQTPEQNEEKEGEEAAEVAIETLGATSKVERNHDTSPKEDEQSIEENEVHTNGKKEEEIKKSLCITLCESISIGWNFTTTIRVKAHFGTTKEAKQRAEDLFFGEVQTRIGRNSYKPSWLSRDQIDGSLTENALVGYFNKDEERCSRSAVTCATFEITKNETELQIDKKKGADLISIIPRDANKRRLTLRQIREGQEPYPQKELEIVGAIPTFKEGLVFYVISTRMCIATYDKAFTTCSKLSFLHENETIQEAKQLYADQVDKAWRGGYEECCAWSGGNKKLEEHGWGVDSVHLFSESDMRSGWNGDDTLAGSASPYGPAYVEVLKFTLRSGKIEGEEEPVFFLPKKKILTKPPKRALQ